jgi:hypothetical protein
MRETKEAPASPRSLIFHVRKCGLQSRHQTHEHGHDASMARGISRTQALRLIEN